MICGQCVLNDSYVVMIIAPDGRTAAGRFCAEHVRDGTAEHELRHLVHHPAAPPAAPVQARLDRFLDRAGREAMVLEVLDLHGGSKSAAARQLRISRSTIYRVLERRNAEKGNGGMNSADTETAG